MDFALALHTFGVAPARFAVDVVFPVAIVVVFVVVVGGAVYQRWVGR